MLGVQNARLQAEKKRLSTFNVQHSTSNSGVGRLSALGKEEIPMNLSRAHGLQCWKLNVECWEFKMRAGKRRRSELSTFNVQHSTSNSGLGRLSALGKEEIPMNLSRA